jgi:proteasome lid subunit RPN8/RPN11
MQRISERLMREIKFTAKIVAEIVGKGIECEGVIAGGGWGRYSLLPVQDVAETSSTAYGIKESLKEAYRRNLNVLGVWHSHGDFSAFHSSDDDKHIVKTVMPLIQKYNLQIDKSVFYEKEKDGVKVYGSRGILKLKGKVSSVEEVLEDKVLSIVVNCHDEDYYAALFGDCAKEVELDLIPDKERVDELQIIKDSGERLSYQGLKLKEFPNYQELLKRYSLENKLLASRFRNKLSLSGLKAILAGENFERWDDRIAAFRDEYIGLKSKPGIHKQLKIVEENLERKKHLKRKHPKLYSEIKNKIKELKYRSLFKEIRKKRLSQRNSG